MAEAAVPAVSKSAALEPESVRLPLLSRPAKLPEVAEVTLSALLATSARMAAAPVVSDVIQSEISFRVSNASGAPFTTCAI
jgi:hypothetical protein